MLDGSMRWYAIGLRALRMSAAGVFMDRVSFAARVMRARGESVLSVLGVVRATKVASMAM